MSAVWRSQVQQAIVALDRGAKRAVREAGEDLARESGARVPYDQGDLDRSRKVTTGTDAGAAVAHVSYDTVYAARQHEEHTWRHDPGRTSDYLGGPMRTGASRRAQHIAKAIADELG